MTVIALLALWISLSIIGGLLIGRAANAMKGRER